MLLSYVYVHCLRPHHTARATPHYAALHYTTSAKATPHAMPHHTTDMPPPQVTKYESIEKYLEQDQVAKIWYFTRLQLERMGDKIRQQEHQLRSAVTFQEKFMDRVPPNTKFYHPLPRHSQYPTIPNFLDNTPLNNWDKQAMNGSPLCPPPAPAASLFVFLKRSFRETFWQETDVPKSWWHFTWARKAAGLSSPMYLDKRNPSIVRLAGRGGGCGRQRMTAHSLPGCTSMDRTTTLLGQRPAHAAWHTSILCAVLLSVRVPNGILCPTMALPVETWNYREVVLQMTPIQL